MKKRRVFQLVALLVTVSLTGCGDGRPSRVLVSGTVTIDGEPLKKGTVKFVPTGARASHGVIGSDGSFVMNCYEGGDGIVPGTHKVSVSSNKSMGPTAIKWFVPKKYTSHHTSGIEYTIEEDQPDLKIELTWEGAAHKKPYVVGHNPTSAEYLEE